MSTAMMNAATHSTFGFLILPVQDAGRFSLDAPLARRDAALRAAVGGAQ
jgi:hypothetical protein